MQGICGVCGASATVHLHKKKKILICTKCFRKQRVAICIECGFMKIIQACGMCDNCYRINRGYTNKKRTRCLHCNGERPIVKYGRCAICLKLMQIKVRSFLRFSNRSNN